MDIICPHCQQTLEGDDSLVGETVECPNCGQSFVVQTNAFRSSLNQDTVPNTLNSSSNRNDGDKPNKWWKSQHKASERQTGSQIHRIRNLCSVLKRGLVFCSGWLRKTAKKALVFGRQTSIGIRRKLIDIYTRFETQYPQEPSIDNDVERTSQTHTFRNLRRVLKRGMKLCLWCLRESIKWLFCFGCKATACVRKKIVAVCVRWRTETKAGKLRMLRNIVFFPFFHRTWRGVTVAVLAVISLVIIFGSFKFGSSKKHKVDSIGRRTERSSHYNEPTAEKFLSDFISMVEYGAMQQQEQNQRMMTHEEISKFGYNPYWYTSGRSTAQDISQQNMQRQLNRQQQEIEALKRQQQSIGYRQNPFAGGSWSICEFCNGTGVQFGFRREATYGPMPAPPPCQHCRGLGKIYHSSSMPRYSLPRRDSNDAGSGL